MSIKSVTNRIQSKLKSLGRIPVIIAAKLRHVATAGNSAINSEFRVCIKLAEGAEYSTAVLSQLHKGKISKKAFTETAPIRKRATACSVTAPLKGAAQVATESSAVRAEIIDE